MVVTSSRHYLRLIERRLDVGTWTLDLRSGQLACSDRMLRLLAMPPGSALTVDAVIDRVHPDDRWIVDDLMRLSAVPEEERRFRVRLADGPVRWYGCWVDAFGEDPGETWVRRGILRDVTRSQLHMERVIRHHVVFHKLVEMSGGGALRIDAQGAPHRTEAWMLQIGQTQDDLRRRGWTGAVHPEERKAALQAWTDAFEARVPLDGAFRLRRPDGAFERLRVQAEPVVDADGRMLEWLLFLSAPRAAEPAEAGATGPTPTPPQLRGCRGLLDWTVSRLAAESGVSPATIARYEAGKEGAIRAGTLAKLRTSLEAGGVEFTADAGGTAIRLRSAASPARP